MERLTPHDISAIADLCSALPGHALSERELLAALFADDQPTCVYGHEGVGVVATATRDTQGFVRLLAVHRDHRREGIGRALLTFAERQLADQGVVAVTLGADAPHHLWAGVPTAATAMCCLAEAMRYRRVGVNLDVDIPLDRPLPESTGEIGGDWRMVTAEDVSVVGEFCRRHYPEWTNEAVRAAMARTATLLFDGDELICFCAFDVNRRGALGPVAVRPDLVGRGIGRPALVGALQTMRARGDRVAAVQWVGPLRPYIELGGHIGTQYLVYRKDVS